MRRYREQRLCQLANVFHEEVLDILTRQNNGGLLFANALHEISDIFNGGQICQKQIKFIYACDGISAAQKLLGHIREDVKQQRISDIFACLEQSFYAESDESTVRNIRVSVKEFALRTLAYRVQPEAYILQVFGGVEAFSFGLKALYSASTNS